MFLWKNINKNFTLSPLLAWLILLASVVLIFPIPFNVRTVIFMSIIAMSCISLVKASRASQLVALGSVSILILAIWWPLPFPEKLFSGLRLVITLAFWGGLFSILLSTIVWKETKHD